MILGPERKGLVVAQYSMCRVLCRVGICPLLHICDTRFGKIDLNA